MAKSASWTLADGLDDVAKELGKTDTLIGTALRLLTEQDLSSAPRSTRWSGCSTWSIGT